jgi:LmbE family N-acetylglucosaminyl deacetylase
MIFNNSFLPKRVMVLAPHPDDEILGAGGLLSRLAREKSDALVIYGSMPNETRKLEAIQGLSVLDDWDGRIDYEYLYENTDGDLDQMPMKRLITDIEDHVQRFTPDMVIMPEPGGFHQDHRAISQAALAALRPNGGTFNFRPPIVAVYEEPSDYWTLETEQHHPILYVTLSEVDIERKCQAMRAHFSQDRPHPSERSIEAIRALAVLRGAQAGVPLAEAYEVRRWLV